MDKALLDILVCPVTGLSVAPADAAALARVNEGINAGEICYVDDTPVEQPLDAALVTRDGATLYPVIDGIPVMLPERGIALSRPA